MDRRCLSACATHYSPVHERCTTESRLFYLPAFLTLLFLLIAFFFVDVFFFAAVFAGRFAFFFAAVWPVGLALFTSSVNFPSAAIRANRQAVLSGVNFSAFAIPARSCFPDFAKVPSTSFSLPSSHSLNNACSSGVAKVVQSDFQEYSPVVVRADINDFFQFEPGRFYDLLHIFRFHAQISAWSARFIQDSRLFAWSPVPVDDGKAPTGFKCLVYCL